MQSKNILPLLSLFALSFTTACESDPKPAKVLTPEELKTVDSLRDAVDSTLAAVSNETRTVWLKEYNRKPEKWLENVDPQTKAQLYVAQIEKDLITQGIPVQLSLKINDKLCDAGDCYEGSEPEILVSKNFRGEDFVISRRKISPHERLRRH